MLQVRFGGYAGDACSCSRDARSHTYAMATLVSSTHILPASNTAKMDNTAVAIASSSQLMPCCTHTSCQVS